MLQRVLVVSVVLSASAVLAQNATTPGTAVSVSPTTWSLSLEWPITGDADLDSKVTVRYRAQGTTAWTNGPALVRVPAGTNTSGTFGSGGGQWGNKHSGSLFDLTPGTDRWTATTRSGVTMTSHTDSAERLGVVLGKLDDWLATDLARR